MMADFPITKVKTVTDLESRMEQLLQSLGDFTDDFMEERDQGALEERADLD